MVIQQVFFLILEFDESKQAVPISNAPKPPENRVSLTPNRLSMADYVIFLVTGKG